MSLIALNYSMFFFRLSELLVGAPFYSDDLYPEQGRVYVYENKGNGNLVLSHKLPTGGRKDRWRANFGRALAPVGDIDLDGYQGMGNLRTSEKKFILLVIIHFLVN